MSLPLVAAAPPRLIIGRQDAVDAVRLLPPGSVDLFLTDPAYESLERHRAIGTTTRLAVSSASSNAWFPIFPNRRFGPLLAAMYVALRPERHSFIVCDEETADLVKVYARQAGFYVWRSLTWVKVRKGRGDNEGHPVAFDREAQDEDVAAGLGYHGRSATERIVFLEKRSSRCDPVPFPAPQVAPKGSGRQLSDRSMPDVLFYPRVTGKGAYPTEKPVALAERLILQSTEPDELVVDPFAGSGWTAQAALNTGRRCATFDVADASIERMNQRFEGVPRG